MRIGSLKLESNLFLSPLAGYTNLPMRLTLRELGGLDWATTDLVNARSLVERKRQALQLIQTCPAELFLAVQLFGSPPEEMREQVESSVARILALRPRDVLEIGSGTGLLMGRIAPHCVSYLGTDFSANAIWHARQQIASRWDLGHVVLQQRMADDLAGIPAGSVDVVTRAGVLSD